jgi:hypothetical protein
MWVKISLLVNPTAGWYGRAEVIVLFLEVESNVDDTYPVEIKRGQIGKMAHVCKPSTRTTHFFVGIMGSKVPRPLWNVYFGRRSGRSPLACGA